MIDEVVHENPAWCDKADFMIGAKFELEGLALIKWEQLWARQLDKHRFEICCIPFFVYGIALGDEVETVDSEEGLYTVRQVVKKSGHHTFRIWFRNHAAKDALPMKLKQMHCLMEWRWRKGNLLAVDAATDEQAQVATNLLQQWEERGYIEYEISE